ncbi:hypothetical protein COCON_G00177560 [Conger conger]|uniref:Uncharacterized protein n=1 Tax=Conger conger TaxID=82655 RepID=A0A9Q1D523_CONCO|nr:hypothetical protein COCON_G00177560 [Conger conger]
MFLYWKKRGAYELETLPSSLAELGAERYSWSSSLDVIHDLVGIHTHLKSAAYEKFSQEEKSAMCQHPDCPDHRRAAKVRGQRTEGNTEGFRRCARCSGGRSALTVPAFPAFPGHTRRSVLTGELALTAIREHPRTHVSVLQRQSSGVGSLMVVSAVAVVIFS